MNKKELLIKINEDNMNPKIIYFDNELGETRLLAGSFKEFIGGLEIEEAFKEISLPSDNLGMFIDQLRKEV